MSNSVQGAVISITQSRDHTARYGQFRKDSPVLNGKEKVYLHVPHHTPGCIINLYKKHTHLNESGIWAWYHRLMSKTPMKVDGWPCPYDLTCQLKTDTLVSGDVTRKRKNTNVIENMQCHSITQQSMIWIYIDTFIHAVFTIRVVAKLLYGLTADQTGIDGLSSQRKCCTVQVLTVTFLTILQTLRVKHHTLNKYFAGTLYWYKKCNIQIILRMENPE